MRDLLARLKSNYSDKAGSEDLNARHRLYFSKTLLLQKFLWAMAAVAIIAIGCYIDQLNNSNYKMHVRNQADNTLKIIAARLEGNILGNMQTSKAMVAAVHSNPAISQADFAQFAKPLFDGSAQLRNISATRDLRLQYMYPVDGNEIAIGFDYHQRPDQLKDLLRARETQQTVISGPFELIQGGQGLIIRLPVLVPNTVTQSPEIWGTISAVIDLQRLYNASGLLQTNSELNIAIRKISTDSSAVFFGNTSAFYTDAQPVMTNIAMPSGDKWELAAIPKDGWPLLAKNASAVRLYLILAGLIVLSMIVVISQQINRRQQNNLLLRSLFDLSPIGIALSDFGNGEFLQVNDSLLASTSYNREEFLALNYWQLGARKKDEAEQYQLRALQKTGRYGPYERNYIRKDGSEFPVRLSGVLIRDDSGKSFVWSIIEDISAQKKTAEIMQRQQSLMRSMGAQARVGAWEYIVRADKMYWSEMTRKIFKVNDNFSPSRDNINEFYHTNDSQQRLNKSLNEAMIDGVPFSEEIKIRTANGRETWIHITGQAEFYQSQCVRVYGSVQDIDSRRKVRDELIEAKEKAEAAVHAKSEFLAVMSHEIRTPMNGVLGMLNLLENSPLSTDQDRKVHIAKTSAQSLLNLINDILDFSKVDAGKLQLENIVFNIRKLFDDIAASQALHAHEKGLELIVDQSAIKQSWVMGDPARLRQIVTNLLANAIKFTHQGNIILRAGLRTKNGNLVLSCAITDTGIGIPDSELKRLFSPFTQIDASTTRKFGGSGLGLSICKNLCELMGGSISVASTYQDGSTFTFDVCLQDGSNRELADPVLPSIRNRRICILDDNLEFKTSLSKQLQLWGANVYIADCAEALIRQTTSPDIVIIGVQIQGLDIALNLSSLLRQHSIFNTSVIIFASNIDIADTSKLSAAGVNACYLKPLSHTDLSTAFALKAHDKMPIEGPRIGKENKLTALVLADQAKPITPHCNALKHEEFSPYKILLVEDNPVNQEVGRCTLEEIGLPVDIAANGKLALEMLNKTDPASPYALILLDCQMPEMDGYQVCKYIRSGHAGDDYRAIPVIALTANAMTGDKEKCISAGMNDYLPKPFTPHALIEKLQQWLTIESPNPLSNIAPSTNTDPEETNAEANIEPAMWLPAKALDSAMGRPEVLKKLLELFCEQISTQLCDIENAYAESDIEKITNIAHAVKGSAGQLQGIQLHQCAASLERAGKDNDTHAISRHYEEFQLHSQNLKACFEQYLHQANAAASNSELI
ncbi:response regulator [Zhongshania sp.]|uniref:response regulator n=1 Tax=Zhongshania sp. TaxID=1971902 RepID=UPI001B49A060|nr:response regulator [Zhongshania sp.]MBQ0796356.1 response regulator [Zhongshania sp.]